MKPAELFPQGNHAWKQNKASRELKDEEKELGLTATVIAKDGIAVVVNNTNETEDLTSDQVKAVFTGETTEWEDLAK